MPRTKGSKNRPKITNDYASQIAEKQEFIATLNTVYSDRCEPSARKN